MRYRISQTPSSKLSNKIQTLLAQFKLLEKSFEDVTVIAPERLGQDKAYVIDSTKARAELGWSPKISLEEGLSGVVQWVNDFWEEIGSETLEYVHKP